MKPQQLELFGSTRLAPWLADEHVGWTPSQLARWSLSTGEGRLTKAEHAFLSGLAGGGFVSQFAATRLHRIHLRIANRQPRMGE